MGADDGRVAMTDVYCWLEYVSLAIGGKKGYKFVNWSESAACEPEAYFEPKSRDEIRQILLCAQQRGKRVKVVGRGHSLSDIACTTDYMVNLKYVNRVLGVNKEKCQVTVEGGITIQDLVYQTLYPNDMCISVFGSTSNLTLAGVMSTGMHGTGQHYGITSTYILSLELMLATGEVLVVSPEENADLFPAVLCSLGSLGLILSVTLQCEPAYKLRRTNKPDKLDNVLVNLESCLSESDHFRFLWIPHTDDVVVFHASRTNEADQLSKPHWLWDRIVGTYVLGLCLWISSFFPSFVKTINRQFFAYVLSRPGLVVGKPDVVCTFDSPNRLETMDWSIPREHTSWALRELKSWIDQTGFPAHLLVEVRFVKQDNIYLSAAYGRHSCYINPVMFRPYGKLVPPNEYWEALTKIALQVGGRPHWGKTHYLGPEQFRQLYPHWDTFCQIRKRLDPNGRFLNSYLERVFGTD